MKKVSLLITTFLFIVSLVIGCGQPPSAPLTPTLAPTLTPTPTPTPSPAPTATGTIEMRATDAPPSSVSKITVTASNIQVHKANAPEDSWITVVDQEKTFDLVAIQGAEVFLGQKNVASGNYTQIRLDVTKVIVTLEGKELTAKLPGEKLKVVRPWEVKPGEKTILTLDFEADKFVVITGKDEAQVKPVLKLDISQGERPLKTKPATTAAPAPTPSPAPMVWAKPSAPVTLSVDAATNKATYKSGSVDVPGYFYRPSGNGPFPAVLVLHGKAGLGEGQRSYASWLATQGYVALAPDYFTPIGMTAEKFDASWYEKYVDPARELLAQGLESLKSLPYVDPKRIGVVGFSLGGYTSFILATRDDVKGIVSYYGAYAPTLRAPRYPLTDIITQIKAPVLMFHGDKDEMVPIADANAARDLLTKNGKQVEYTIYPGARHAFDIQGAPTPEEKTATADAQQRVIAFFKAKLQ